jgi:hypothetical protein
MGDGHSVFASAADHGISTGEEAPMSTTRTVTNERGVAAIGELDEVALLGDVDGWRLGTTGTVVEVSPAHLTIEIVDHFGESLDFLEVPTERLRLVEKCAQPGLDFARGRARKGAEKKQVPLPIGEHDVVALLVAIDGWPAGTTGTVVHQSKGYKMIEISNHLGEDLAFLDVPPDQLKVVWRTTRRSDRD